MQKFRCIRHHYLNYRNLIPWLYTSLELDVQFFSIDKTHNNIFPLQYHYNIYKMQIHSYSNTNNSIFLLSTKKKTQYTYFVIKKKK